MNAQIRNNQAVTAEQGILGELSPAVARDVEAVTLTNTYPAGAVLFAEADTPRGVFVVVRGRVIVGVRERWKNAHSADRRSGRSVGSSLGCIRQGI